MQLKEDNAAFTDEMMQKLIYIAEFERRPMRALMTAAYAKYIQDFEAVHGKIQVPPKRKGRRYCSPA